MRKIAFIALGTALLLSAACAKVDEIVAPEANPETVTPEVTPTEAEPIIIQAVIKDGADTKTAYTENGNKAEMKWLVGDEFKLLVYAKEGNAANFYRCVVQTVDGENPRVASTLLTGDFDETNFARGGYAVYPSSLAIGGTKDAYTVTLPAEYNNSTSDLTQVKVPIVGIADPEDQNLYTFQNAVGVIKFTLTDVPVEARKLVLETDSDNLAGTFPLDVENGFQMSACSNATSSITVTFPQQAAGSTIGVYMPVPVGTITAGARIKVQDGSGNDIKSGTMSKAIPITKGQMLRFPAFAVEKWVSLGTGKFIDNHTFYQAQWSNTGDPFYETYFDVEIQQHAVETNRYRVVNPYGPMFDTYGTTQFGSGPYDYLTFTVRNDLGNDIVINDSFRTGIKQYGEAYELWHDNPYWYNPYPGYVNNRIIKKDGDNILNVQLAPIYFGYVEEDCSYNPKIEIVFPGATPMLGGAFNYANDALVEYNEKTLEVTLQNAYITAIKVKIGETAEDCLAALEAGEADYTFTENGQLQPLDALAAGNYCLAYKVETDGHGYTYKFMQFEIVAEETKTEIGLNVNMITVSSDCSYNSGNELYDGDGYGALVDGDLETYWHSAYNSYPEDDYNWNNLDPTYGVYIDIDLGEVDTVCDFEVRACLRAGATNDFPKHVIVYSSADGTVWNQVGEAEDAKDGHADGEWIDPIECTSDSSARYIRISIISNSSDNDLRVPAGGCTHLAEIKLFE